MLRAAIFGLLINLCFASVVYGATLSQTFTVDGQLFLTGTTTPLLDGTAKITVYIMDPSGTCLLYAEEQTVDTVTSNGYFNVQVGSNTGAGKRVGGVDPGRTMVQVYSNNAAIAASNVPGQTCAGGTYTPSNGDGRLVRVIVTPTAGIPDTLTPDLAMDLAPMSKVAETIQGLAPASLLQVNNSGSVALTQTNLEAMFTGTAYTRLQSVMAGTFGAGAASSVNAMDGTVSAPSMSFSNDTDTGFYSSGSNQIGIASSGVNIFNIGASGIVSSTTGGAAVTTAAGTAAAPTFGFAGDAGLGWFRPSASTLAASTSGAERVRISSTGFVGIGTTNPTSKLHLGEPGVTSVLTTYTNSNATTGFVTGISSAGNGLVWHYNNLSTVFGNNNAETMRINASGNVGIGVTSPTARLEIAGGDLRINGSTSGYVGLRAPAVAGSGILTLPATTGTAGQTLTTDGSGVLSWTAGGAEAVFPIALGSATTPSMNFSGDTNTGIYSPGADTVAIATSGVERLRVDNTGSIGIGTTSPENTLHVRRDANDAQTQLLLQNDSNGGTARVGLVGKRNTVSVFTLYNNSAQTTLRSLGAQPLSLGTSNTDQLTIDASGKVGIGTTSPSATLEVAGSTKIGGILTVNNSTAAVLGDSGSNYVLRRNVDDNRLILAGGSSASSGGGISVYGGSHSTAPNLITFSNGATEAMRISGNGSVGIGTTAPSTGFEVAKGISGNPATSGTTQNGILRLSNGGTNVVLDIGTNNSTGLSWLQATNNSNLGATYSLAINPNGGSVGIGTLSPTAKLEIAGGDLRISGSTSGYVGLRAPAVAGSGILTLPATTGTAGQTLTTDGSGVLSWTAGGAEAVFPIALGSATTPSMNFSGDTNTGIYSPGADTVAIATSGVERLRVSSTGFVGVGTLSPTTRLSVVGGQSVFRNGTPTFPHQLQTDSESLHMYVDDSNVNFISEQNENSGYRGGFNFYMDNDGTQTPQFQIFKKSDTTNAVFAINYLNNVLIGSGNVGIGTTTPGAKLDIAGGDLRISGSTSGYVGLRAPAVAGSGILTLPSTVGTSGQTLITDGSGVLSWSPGGAAAVFPIALGSAGTPSMNFSGDTNTGFYSPGLDEVAVSTNGTEKLRITSTGYVGIGTTNPSANLHVSNNSGAKIFVGANGVPSSTYTADSSTLALPTGHAILNLANYGNLDDQFVGITMIADNAADTGQGAYFGALTTVSSSRAPIVFGQRASSSSFIERMRLDGSGNLGIGTTSPTARLEIAGGDLRINGSTSGYVGLRAPAVAGSGILTLPATTGTAGQTLVTDGSGVLSWTAGGAEAVFPIALGSAATPSMNFSGDTDTGIFSPAANTVAIATSAAERVRISSTGFVGIGTSAPTAVLEVAQLATSASGLKVQGFANNATPVVQIITGGSPNNSLLSVGASANETLAVYYGGKVGIGTNLGVSSGPTYNLSFGGNTTRTIGLERNTGAGNAGNTLTISGGGAVVGGLNKVGGNLLLASGLSTGNGASSIEFQTYTPGVSGTADNSISTKMLLDGSGNLGIGTTSPTARLEIAGGDLRINGSTSGYVGLRAPAVAGSGILTLPATTGTAGQTLVTDGSGVLSWTAGGAEAVFPIALGSAATPSMNFSGDTDTGFYSPGANLVAVSTSGVERLRVHSTGSVGIGITAPEARLDVRIDDVNSSSLVNVMNLYHTTSGTADVGIGAGLAFGSERADGGQTSTGAIYGLFTKVGTSASTNGALAFHTRETSTSITEKMRISHSGFVGIGITDPSAKLHVMDEIRIGGSTSGYVGLKAPAVAGSGVLTLPATTGTAGQTLTTDGSGVLSWTAGGAAAVFPIALGSAGTPSMNFSGDTNTGIYSPGADTVAVSASGVERVRISSTGNVGIGTTSPTNILSVVKDQDTTTRISVSNQSATANAATEVSVFNDAGKGMTLGIRGSAATSTGALISGGGYLYHDSSSGISLISNNTNGTIRFATGGMNEKVRIDQSGNLGIGTTSPTAKLEIAGGDLRINGSTSGYVGLRAPAVAGSGILTLPATTGTAGQTLTTDGSGVLSWTAGGAAGVFPIALGSAATPSMNFSGDTDTGIFSPAADTVAIATSAAERLRVSSTGAVGIGTTSPTDLLHVAGSAKITGNLKGSGSNYIDLNGFGGNAIDFHYSGTGFFRSAQTSIKGSNDIFFQAVPPTTSDYGILETWAGAGMVVGTGGNTAPVIFQINRSEKMRIDSSGNVGIGIASPTAKLEIAGGDLRINGSTSGYVGLRAPAVAGSATYTFPSADGSANSVLTTDGSGLLTWTAGGAAGVFPIALGTSAAPSMNFSGNTDTGIYSPGAARLAISTSGAERLRISSTGAVGIGNTTPTYRLDVIGIGSQQNIRFQTLSQSQPDILTLENYGNGAADRGAGILFNVPVAGSAGSGARIYVGQESALATTYMAFQTAVTGSLTEKFRINSSGYVGIGTTNPVRKLEVADGRLRISDSAAAVIELSNGTHSNVIFTDTSANNGVLNIRTDSTRHIALQTGNSTTGNVGIGTASPLAKLDVMRTGTNAGVTISATNGSTTFTTSGPVTINAGDYIYPTTSTTQARLVSVGGTGTSFTVSSAFTADVTTEAFTINPAVLRVNSNTLTVAANGNVGIGTSTPGAPSVNNGIANLDVIGSGRFFRQLQINSAGSFPQSPKFAMNYGTTELVRFQGDLTSNGTNSSSDLSFWTASVDVLSEAMRIKSSGRVGIGVTGPSEMLEVNGNVKATAFISTSDKRLKRNVAAVPGLSAITQLNGVRFNWIKDGQVDMGVLAQEVEQVFPWAVVTDPNTGYKAVKYDSLVAPLIESTKELQSEILELQQKNQSLQKKNEQLEQRLIAIENLLKEKKQ